MQFMHLLQFSQHAIVLHKCILALAMENIKQKISEIFNVSLERQKLIFQGRMLLNNEKVANCRISHDSVLHLLVKPPENSTSSNHINQVSEVLSNNGSDQQQRTNIEDVVNSLIEIPILRSRRRRRRPSTTFDLSDSFESMHQNITTINNIISCRSKFNEVEIINTRTILPFEFNKVKYEVGQWLDAKDSIDQWLEAQVVHVRNNQVFIHYNGCGVRWDEWIDFSSQRLAPFKTYSINANPGGCYSSPYPSVIPDANIEPLQRNLETFYYVEKAYSYIGELQKTIEEMFKCRKRKTDNNSTVFIKFLEDKEKENKTILDKKQGGFNINNDIHIHKVESNHSNQNYRESSKAQQNFLNSNDLELLHLTAQLVPMMDRVGRYISDVSLHLSHLVTNPNLYPKLILGYNNTLDDSLSCTSGYSMYTNEGSLLGNIHNLDSHHLINNLQKVQNSNQVINDYPNNIRPVNQQSNNNANIQQILQEQYKNSLPKINLQFPAVQHANLTSNAYTDPNVDLYVHTLIAPRLITSTIQNNLIQNNSNIEIAEAQLSHPNENTEAEVSEVNTDEPQLNITSNTLLRDNIDNIDNLINLNNINTIANRYENDNENDVLTEKNNKSFSNNTEKPSSRFKTTNILSVNSDTGVNKINELHNQRKNRHSRKIDG